MSSASQPDIDEMSYSEILEFRDDLKSRICRAESKLTELTDTKRKKKKIVQSKNNTTSLDSNTDESNIVFYQPKPDIHWDFVMKEMMWLAADFQSERKRQISKGKKISGAVKQFHRTKETRKLRELAEIELKKRRTAAKMARDVKGWWKKIDKIISLKQKIDADEVRKQQMDKHLIFLVKQTEKYTYKISQNTVSETEKESDSQSTSPSRNTRSKMNSYNSNITIEEALARSTIDSPTSNKIKGLSPQDKSSTSSGKKRTKRVKFSSEENNEKGKKSAPDNDSQDSSEKYMHMVEESFPDETSTERKSARKRKILPNSSEDLDKKEEKYSAKSIDESKYTLRKKSRNRPESDSSDVNDRLDSNRTLFTGIENNDEDDKDKEEFQPNMMEGIDDETTLIAEEKLGKEISHDEEIAMLQGESEVPIEELRKMYAKMEESMESNDEQVDVDDDPNVSESAAVSVGTQSSDVLNLQVDSDKDDISEKDEFQPNIMEGIDDETTLIAEEKLGKEMSHDEEIAMLQGDSEVPIEELRKMYAKMEESLEQESEVDDVSHLSDSVATSVETSMEAPELDLDVNDDTEKDEFQPNMMEGIDDETTLIAEEKLGREMSHDEEIAMLQGDSEVPIEELRKMYAKMEESMESNDKQVEVDDDPNVSESPAVSVGTQSDVLNLQVDSDKDDISEKDEFQPDVMEGIDDETTLIAEEKLGREMSHDEEIAMLQGDSEVPIEELRKMYAKMEERLEQESGSVATSNDSSSGAPELDLDVNDDTEKDEFQPDVMEGIDDETTLIAEERLGREMSHDEEIAMLQGDSEVPIEELRKMYAKMEESMESNDQESEVDDVSHLSDSVATSVETLEAPELDLDVNDDTEKDEFQPNIMEGIDDETTLIAEEKLGREMSHDEEIAMLQGDSEVPIEELRKMYAKMEESMESNDQESEVEPLSSTTKGSSEKVLIRNDQATSALQKLKDSDEKARKTLVSVPFLLAPWLRMREYQRIGLNWLVSIQTRRLNGILADEMGLGKTLQTISLLSYLASYKGIWGPHLIIVPTSCIVNWEVELKRFCPAFKVLCYYGSAKRRKELRQGWTKANWHHVVITSYQLAVQDSFAFKRKRWYYLILDEAQNIKNFQSQRWQTLVNFNTQRRLLLTGTPLQNNLMELWSLLHFLMPHVFKSRKEFSYWFSNPMNNIVEGNANRNDDLIGRLHGIIRPFILRRLKKDVETQMPGKYEHIVSCQLSRRQIFLYEEFMARSSTRMALKKGGNFLGMMNVLMQLRKVCNHPDLFEPRSVITPFCMDTLRLTTAGCIVDALKPTSNLIQLSQNLLHPLWSIGSGVISYDETLKHDNIYAEQLSRLMTPLKVMVDSMHDDDIREAKPDQKSNPELYPLLVKLWNNAKNEKRRTVDRHSFVNQYRCQGGSFAYSNKLLFVTQIDRPTLDKDLDDCSTANSIANTPSALLAMRKTQMERADELDSMFNKYVFCVPKAVSGKPILNASKIILSKRSTEAEFTSSLMKPLQTYFKPYRKPLARLSTFFPDKKLVQFDAGKLQSLAVLLHDLKRGKHRCLIFTQMSKMLDILEAFLNLNGHTYVRLDGSTGVDARQRLMDRFNNDTKIFCFILSTRSGGLGINLTGADTVIFYDSDWNPAMDAQAQDRAHRIGQTRDVHIYRLVSQHTIEENILIKAKQKRHLDFLVMDEGKFHAEVEDNHKPDEKKSENEDKVDIFSKGGLRDILGVTPESDDETIIEEDQDDNDDSSLESKNNENELSKEQMENAMAALEDEDDVEAMKGAQKEAADELQEFDETVQFNNDGDDSISRASRDDDIDDDSSHHSSKNGKRKKKKAPANASRKRKKAKADTTAKKENNEDDVDDAEVDKELAAFDNEASIDFDAITSKLRKTELYALRFREDVDPFYSEHYHEMNDESNMDISDDDWDIDEIERAKEEEEQRAMRDGDLLATNPHPEVLCKQRQMYFDEKASIRAKKMLRKLTGENWCKKIDGRSKLPFWYNDDTGEALWDKPRVLLDLEAYELAHKKKWNFMPLKPLVNIMSFLVPLDRMKCTSISRQWRTAASDISFVKHVYPVEMASYIADKSKLTRGHYLTLAEALEEALPGDILEFSDGHYWINEPGITVNFPLKFVGDENDPSHVIWEMSGTIVWKAKGGWMEGITARRPKMASECNHGCEILRLEGEGRFDMAHNVFDNDGGSENVVSFVNGTGHKGTWEDVVVKGAPENCSGMHFEGGAILNLNKSHIRENGGNGISCHGSSKIQMSGCHIMRNKGYGISLDSDCKYTFTGGKFEDNTLGSTNQEQLKDQPTDKEL